MKLFNNWNGLFYMVLLSYFTVTYGNEGAKKLFQYVMKHSGYNPIIRPVNNETDQVMVHIGLTLAQIIDVDENNQILTTNVWVTQKWHDNKLVWDPDDFDDVTYLYVPANSIWHPDIVLYNNADGKYEMTADTKVSIYYDGTVKWNPPASFKSSCPLDVTYFPFDEQICEMQFGSWTYNIHEVEIRHVDDPSGIYQEIPFGIDLHGFYRSVEWDVMGVPARKDNFSYAGSVEKFRKWTFKMVLKRRFLFYTINLIIPLVSHAFITILVFYLPGDSKEKIALCINILLSLTVFFLMLAEIVPPSSHVTPLLGKYLVFTLMLVVFSVIITVITYNVHFRSSATHTMPDWIRKVFLYWLPRILRMRRPKIENSHDVELKHIKLKLCSCVESEDDPHKQWLKNKLDAHHAQQAHAGNYQFGSKRTRTQVELMNLSRELDEDTMTVRGGDTSQEVQDAIEGALYIANHLKQEDEFNRTKEDWKYVALVMDRCFLWIYIMICLFGTIGIICQAPMMYDKRKPITS